MIRAPADGRMSGPTLMTREVMKRAAPTLVFKPTPRFTCDAYASQVGTMPCASEDTGAHMIRLRAAVDPWRDLPKSMADPMLLYV